MEQYASYAAIIIAVVGFCIQFGMFVRPVELEKKHREILEESYKKFASVDALNGLKSEIQDLKCKLDQIYDILIQGK